jgi:hypothetical protein
MDSGLSAYEKQRLENIAANVAVLEALGLGSGGLLPVPKKAAPKKKVRVAQPKARCATLNTEDGGGYQGGPRKSRRLSGDISDLLDEGGEAQALRTEGAPVKLEKPPDIFGEIEGFKVGSYWDTRAECCADLVHRATVAGIVGTPEAGCYSIVLNGGYADDVDQGEYLTYTGSGGRSLKGTASNPKNLRTGPATHNQTLEGKEGRFNAALFKSSETGLPVRVVRGYKLDSRWAPLGIEYGGEVNYRYDGLYKVEKAWLAPGLEGYKVWKFALKRGAGQPELATEEAPTE